MKIAFKIEYFSETNRQGAQGFNIKIYFKGRSRRLRPKVHILDDPLGNPYDVLKVLLGPP